MARVRVVVPVLVREVGLNVEVTPLGKPLVPNVTAELKPFSIVSVTVVVGLAPGAPLTAELPLSVNFLA
jgi:hypothetical protein